MTRNRAYSIAATALAIVAAVISVIAIFAPAMAGVALLLALGAAVASILRIRSRIHSESRHRWVLKRRLDLLEQKVDERLDALLLERGELEARLTQLESQISERDENEDYGRLAAVHDRIHALETILRPVP